MAEATREVYWNIHNVWLMYALLIPTFLIGGYGVYLRVQRWRIGGSENRFDRPWERIKHFFSLAIAQKRIWRDPLSGLFHSLLFWGFITLSVATTVVLVHEDFHIPIMQGRFYLYFQSLFVDLMGGLAFVAILIATAQRFSAKPARLVYTSEASWILILLGGILASGFLIEGWRIAATDDPWGVWSPIGFIVGQVSLALANTETLRLLHGMFWWGHLLLVFGFMAWAPYTKMLHALTAALNIYTARIDAPLAKLRQIDFDNDEVFGINRLEQFSWKELLDLDACTECGRCTSVCPANTVGKELSPRDVILDLRTHLSLSTKTPAQKDDTDTDSNDDVGTLVDTAPGLAAEALWQCTTCGACAEACPVAIEQFPKIVDLRRFQVMEEAEYPRQMQDAINSLEQRGHPFRGTQASRTDWSEGMDIPHFKDVEQPEVLLWVGCGGALVDRNQKTTQALANLLKHAGVKFGILGKDEACTGDPARRIGNEFLFDTLVQQNSETFENCQVKTVVTPCPHCFNSFKNEYPEFGTKLEVYHHSTYLAKLIGENRLPTSAVDKGNVTLHDPCYLGRHNDITDAPRAILDAAVTESSELPRYGKQSFCCGGGGGLSFVDEPADKRVNIERAREVVEAGADTVAVACPFCTTMLEDGIGAVQGDKNIVVKDVAELMWDAVQTKKPSDSA